MLTSQQEIALAKEHGFSASLDAKRGVGWCYFFKNDEYVWEASYSGTLVWMRAKWLRTRYAHTQYFKTLEDALIGNQLNTVAFDYLSEEKWVKNG